MPKSGKYFKMGDEHSSKSPIKRKLVYTVDYKMDILFSSHGFFWVFQLTMLPLVHSYYLLNLI